MGRYHSDRCIVAFDFDGTLATGGTVKAGEKLVLRPDVGRMLKFLKSREVYLILWTCRDGESLDRALNILRWAGLGDAFSAVNDNIPGLEFTTSRKIYADYYVDDLAFGWRWGKRAKWLPLIELLERDKYFDPHGVREPGFLVEAYLEFLRR